MKFQAHRGVGTEFPENTMPAFEAAFAQGYEYIELDPAFTKDGKCVVLHDGTLNRTCRTADGKPLQTEIPISDITYEQALAYDAGIAKDLRFRGTKIPLLSEVLEAAERAAVTVKIDNKIRFFSQEQTAILFDTVESSGAQVGFTCADKAYIEKVLDRFPYAEIHYDGPVCEETLAELRAVLKENELYVWLPVKSPATSWVKVPTADKELCQTVKKYGKLGLWILENEEQLQTAEAFQADIIETPGQLKPVQRKKR